MKFWKKPAPDPLTPGTVFSTTNPKKLKQHRRSLLCSLTPFLGCGAACIVFGIFVRSVPDILVNTLLLATGWFGKHALLAFQKYKKERDKTTFLPFVITPNGNVLLKDFPLTQAEYNQLAIATQRAREVAKQEYGEENGKTIIGVTFSQTITQQLAQEERA